MVSWIYSDPGEVDFATGGTRTFKKCARSSKTARGPPKVRGGVPQSSRCIPWDVGEDPASIEVLKVILWHFESSRPKFSGTIEKYEDVPPTS